VLIGRADDCEIRIKSASISRHHCAIEIDDKDWVIRDLGSTHGTLVDGVQISEAAVVPGLKVVIGPAVLLFEASAGRVAAEIGEELEEKE
jgi:pSer/pThr/pTyr-binding forkhead associated (FHA) protein